MKTTPLNLPIGVRDQNRFAKDAPVTVPPEGIKNVRMVDIGGRRRPTSRNRLAKVFADALPGGVKHLYPMGRASTLQDRWGALQPLAGAQAIGVEGTPRNHATITGTVRIIDAAGNTYFGFQDPDYGTTRAVKVAIDTFDQITAARGTSFRGAFAINYTKAYGGAIGNQVITRVSWLKETPANAGGDGPITREWTAEVEDKAVGGSVDATAVDLPCKSLAVVGPWVFVAAGKYVYGFAADTSLGYTVGQYVQRITPTLSGTIQKIVVVPNIVRDPNSGNAVDYTQTTAELLILCDGETTVTGLVTASGNSEGLYARAAVYRYTINLTAATTVPLTQAADAPFASQDSPDAIKVKGENYVAFRFRQWIQSGRGRASADMASYLNTTSDVQPFVRFAGGNKVIVATSNDGFGPTNAAADKPDGSGGYGNLWCLDNGALWDASEGAYATASPVKWLIDTNSRKTNWQASGFFNDLPYNAAGAVDPDNGFGPEFSITSVAVNPVGGDVYAAGKDSSGVNVFCHALNDGARRWSQNVGGLVPQHCVAFFSPASSVLSNQTSVVVGGDRNNAWAGATGQACLWFLNPTTGAINSTRDFGVGIDVYGVAAGKRYVMVASDHF